MKFKSSIYIILLGLLLFSCSKEYENPLTDLKEEGIHTINIHLYPSTIRMINIGNDASFFEATKGIKGLHVMSIDLSDTLKASLFNSWEENQSYQEWEEILQASVMGNIATVYAPSDTENIYFSKLMADGTLYLIWAEGSINFKELMKVTQNGIDLGPLNSYLGNISKDKKRKEIRRRTREELRQLEMEDSLSNINQ